MAAAAPEWDAAYASGEYRTEWEYSVPSQELVTYLAAARMPQGSVALDVGCGAGREAMFMAALGYRVTGVDFSAAAIDIARSRARRARVNVDWRLADALDLPLADASVDFINDRGCFHVIARNRRARFAAEIARVLKPHGSMLLRGSARDSRYGFVAITAQEVDRWFPARQFSRGPVLPILMMADSGTLRGKLVTLQRRPASVGTATGQRRRRR